MTPSSVTWVMAMSLLIVFLSTFLASYPPWLTPLALVRYLSSAHTERSLEDGGCHRRHS
jgi:hypothetical protein